MSIAPGPAACRFCGAPIDRHQAARGAICAAPACQTRRVQEASRAVFHRNWDDYVERQRAAAMQAAPAIAAALRQLGGQTGPVAIGVVPRLDRPLTPVPADRRAAFTAWLDEIIAAAFAEPVPAPEIEPGRRAREEAPEPPLIGATCATCGGLCCTLGGLQHAFLTAADIQRFRLRHPELDAAAVRAHYLDRMPERAVEHSCLFQSETGCTLDRADRAGICNRYHCNPQTQLLMRMREMQAEQAVIIAHEGGDEGGDEGDDGDGGEAVISTFDARAGLTWLAAEEDEAPGADEIDAARQAALAQVPAPLPVPPAAAPPPDAAARARACAFCGAEIDAYRAATTRSCGAPACEQARGRELARAAAAREQARRDGPA